MVIIIHISEINKEEVLGKINYLEPSLQLPQSGEVCGGDSWAASDTGEDDPGESQSKVALVFTFLVLLWQGSSVGLNLRELIASPR
ncbi:hypothetical protein SESBI_09912 [Sesbania bispinosa]|nr:hypothetical protein SESBI_09912 [Sesbania bispinosa]